MRTIAPRTVGPAGRRRLVDHTNPRSAVRLKVAAHAPGQRDSTAAGLASASTSTPPGTGSHEQRMVDQPAQMISNTCASTTRCATNVTSESRQTSAATAATLEGNHIDGSSERMSRIVLITGGNRGLGFLAAKGLTRAGATVVIGARGEAAARKALVGLR